MDWGGWAVFGLVATAGLTAVMMAAQLAGLTRLDIPLMLGTVVAEDPDHARVAGFFMHLAMGQVFALFYAAAFDALDEATWWLGGLFGLGHAVVALAVHRPSPARRASADGDGPRGTRLDSDPRAAGALRPELRSPDAGVRDGRARRLRRGARPAADPVNAVPIGDYGLIGDTRTAALVAPDGAIDWCCLPRFDDAPVFGRLVGGPEAGWFALGPATTDPPVARRYHGHTATLITTWRVGSAEGRTTEVMLEDSMVAEVSGHLLPTTVLRRRLSCRGGDVTARVQLVPRFGYRREPAHRAACRHGALLFEHESLVIAVTTDGPHLVPDAEVEWTLTPDRPVTFVLAAERAGPAIIVPPRVANAAVARDERGWAKWCEGLEADVPFSELVIRSLLTLQLLTYSPSGAPVAAPTTSLPEELGGSRNWDYRYAWPRDAAIGIGAFMAAGRRARGTGVSGVVAARHPLVALIACPRCSRSTAAGSAPNVS